MHADPMRRLPVSPDALMCGPHQSDGNPTLDLTARPGVGLLLLCVQATGYTLQGFRRLHTQKSIRRGNKCVEVHALL